MTQDLFADTNDKYYLKSLGNALRILDIFEQEKRGLTITELAQITELDRSAIHRIISTMVDGGYMVRMEKKYYLSGKFISLANAHTNSYPLLHKIHHEMECISSKHHETTLVSFREGDNLIIADYCEPAGASFKRSQLGFTMPLNCTSIGKIYLSQYDDDEIRRIMAKEGFFRSTEKSICDIDGLLEEVHFVRENGYACCVGEYMLDTGAIGVPVFGSTNKLVAGISLSYGAGMTASRLAVIIEDMLATSRILSGSLGNK